MKTNYFKQLSIVFAISLFAKTLLAQGPYVYIDPGFNFKMSTQNIDGFHNFTLVSRVDTSGQTSSLNTYEQVNVSLGKGFTIAGAFGYMFSKHIGAELNLSYLIGGKNKAESSSTYYTPTNVLSNTGKTSLSGSMFRINPTLVLEGGCENFNPYAKFGLLIGIGSILKVQNDDNNGVLYTRKTCLNGGMALGFNAGIGASYRFCENFFLFGELNMVNLSYAPTRGKLIEATYDGEDVLEDMTIREKETEFVKEYSDEYNVPVDTSEPKKELRQKYPFGSFGINVGVKFRFGNCEKAKT